MTASVLTNPGFYMTYALVQAVVVLLLIRFLDLYEREPLSVLALMAFWGATGAAALSLAGNEALDNLLSGDARTVFAGAVSAPLVEESAKGVVLVAAVGASRWISKRFDVPRFEGLTKGIAYGAAVGLGFAFTEDFFYFLDRARSQGLDAGLDVFLGRRDFFGPAVLHHPLFTAAFGAGLGLASWSRRRAARVGFALAGFAVAVLMHAVNNGLVELVLTQRYGLATAAAWSRGEPVPANVSSTAHNLFIGLGVLDYVYLGAFLTAIAFWLRYQRRVIRSELVEETQSGLVSPEDSALVVRYWPRSRRYWQLLRNSRFEQWRSLRRLHRALAELALLKWRLRRYGGDWSLVNRARRAIVTLATFDDRPSNLPTDLGLLIGRARELDEITALLTSSPRLVTLTGPGGVGKTRLALHVASRLRDDLASGAFFVPRVADPDPALLLPAIGQALGLNEADGGAPALGRLRDFLRDKQLLLVIDSFEQTIDAAPEVAELLASAPRLKLLVTSRQALRISGEHEYALVPLSFPMPGAPTTPEELRGYGAVQLFMHQAQAVVPSFELTTESGPAVSEICRELEGLPLALNLAAGRVRVLPVDAMAKRLKDPLLTLLTGGERDVTIRHQTLRSTIEWSYSLLDPEEQRLFTRLAVFASGCTLEAAEAVCNAPQDLRASVLDSLSSLVEKNLVRQPVEGTLEPRYAMLATIREYALEKLAEEPGELRAVRAAHAEYYCSFAERAAAELSGAEQVLWAGRLDEEYQNFRAALAWALVPERMERLSGALVRVEQGLVTAPADTVSLQLGLRLASVLAGVWEERGHLTEARRWLEAALQAPIELPAKLKARALLGVGRLAQLQSDFARALEELEEALASLRGLNDREGVARGLADLGWVALARGEYEQGERLFGEGLAIARALGDQRLTARLLDSLGRTLAERGELGRGRDAVRRGLTLRESLRDKRDVASSLTTLGRVELLEGRFEEAVHALDRALSLSRDVGAKLRLSDALYVRALAGIELDEAARSSELLQERLFLCREIGDRLGVAEVLDAVGILSHRAGDLPRAVRMLAASNALRQTLGARQYAFERSRSIDVVAAARSQLDAARIEAARSEGASMSLDEAIQAASEPDVLPTVARSFSQPLVVVG